MYDFLKLEDNTRIRIITTPYQYICHSSHLMNHNMGSSSQKLLCPSLGKLSPEPCPLCLEQPARPRWMIGVINRADHHFYLMDMEWKLFTQIRDLAQNIVCGNPETYDIEIRKRDLDGEEQLVVLMCPKTPLTAADLLLKSHIELDYIEQLCNPNLHMEKITQLINNHTNSDKENND